MLSIAPQLPPELVFAKTLQGSEEIASRRHGLSPRMRQLLILVDGRRPVGELCSLFPHNEVVAYLTLLETQGFVRRASIAASAGAVPPAGHPLDGTTAPTPSDAPDVRAKAPAPAAPGVATQGGEPRGTGTAREPSASATRPGSAGDAATIDSGHGFESDPTALHAARGQVVRLLLDAVGPAGEPMAIRIERCSTIDELRALMPQVLALVEAIAGRDVASRFARRIGAG